MRLFILSDIHANLSALHAVADHMIGQGLNTKTPIMYLGDLVGYGPFVNECCDWIFENSKLVLPGNHDVGTVKSWHEAHGGPEKPMSSNVPAEFAIGYAADNLRPDNMDRLKTLVAGPFGTVADNIVFAHANPKDPEGMRYINHVDDAKDTFFRTKIKQAHCFVGHTHIQQLYFQEPGGPVANWIFADEQTEEVAVKGLRTITVVPSVGQPRDRRPQTGYVVYDTEKETITIHRIGYPIEDQQASLRNAGFPASLASRLEDGI
ncbi:MAG: metallophosphoesterase family protein [Candidatus Woesearchaeota archaeon]|nr:metallophosphoesterase family protein [Candidatus Woesearchaeota archaeon]MDP7198542.1 metallophosphoesterase family protein [Candidatus Woesearchaeota archaeon]MDP7466716.1 metallophosphoesterase family protein [Candidatus Woesearchaeota archaeon]MDP7647181.1 metallophosphoesterase family protein [Candidatus Woesearchaeota archaeon]